MRSARRVRTTPGSAARAKAEDIARRVLRGRVMRRLAVVPTGKGDDHDHRNSRPKRRNKSLAARYLEVQRLRQRVLEAEHNGNPR
jgi:hypothetical protein